MCDVLRPEMSPVFMFQQNVKFFGRNSDLKRVDVRTGLEKIFPSGVF